jgi:hypothetical protein
MRPRRFCSPSTDARLCTGYGNLNVYFNYTAVFTIVPYSDIGIECLRTKTYTSITTQMCTRSFFSDKYYFRAPVVFYVKTSLSVRVQQKPYKHGQVPRFPVPTHKRDLKTKFYLSLFRRGWDPSPSQPHGLGENRITKSIKTTVESLAPPSGVILDASQWLTRPVVRST